MQSGSHFENTNSLRVDSASLFIHVRTEMSITVEILHTIPNYKKHITTSFLAPCLATFARRIFSVAHTASIIEICRENGRRSVRASCARRGIATEIACAVVEVSKIDCSERGVTRSPRPIFLDAFRLDEQDMLE